MNPPASVRRFREYLRLRPQYQMQSAIYAKYSAFTMIPQPDYMLNLQLAETVKSIPGAVVECGVWRGGMIAGIAEILGDSRDYVLCDSFQGLPRAQPIDGAAALRWQSNTSDPSYHDNCTAPEEAARSAMALSPARRVQIVAGWFEATLPHIRLNGGIALLRLDADWYESTTTCLENLYHRLAPGGLVVIDDYYTWDGCARALHDFLARHELPARVRQWANTVCYIRVPDVDRTPPGDPADCRDLSRIEH
jgi:O-methyltransferase